jgi:hypothetical protein
MCWGISCEKSRFYAIKSHFFSNFRGNAGPPSWSAPGQHWVNWNQTLQVLCLKVSSTEVQSLDPTYNMVDIGNSVIKTKANLPGTGHHSRFWLSCLGCLDIFFSKTFIFFSFPIYWLWVYLTKIIPNTSRAHLSYLRFYLPSWNSNILTLNGPKHIPLT